MRASDGDWFSKEAVALTISHLYEKYQIIFVFVVSEYI